MLKFASNWSNFARKLRKRSTTDTEFNQSIVRLVMGVTGFTYILVLSGFSVSDTYSNPLVFWVASALYHIAAVLIFAVVYIWPNQFPKRRYLYIILDLGGPIALMSDGGAATLPMFAGVALATLGYGVRYGRKFLLAAMAANIIGLLVIMSMNDFLIQNPFVGYALIATAFATSIYPALLLEQLGNAMRIAQDDDQQKSTFLANASHDLRQPVHVIAMLAAQLSESNLAPAQSELVSRIENSSEALIKLLQSLLDISVIESGELEAKIEPLSLSQLFDEVLSEHQASAERAGLSLRAVASSKAVLSDRALLGTIIQNIVSNSIKYSEDGKILVGCRTHKGKASIWICDQGRGIEDEQIGSVFEMLYRGHGERQADIPGAGLGLAIVKQLSDLLDVTVKLQSVPNKGTVVILGNLPLTNVHPVAPIAKADRQPRLLHGLRVALIDDSPSLLRSTSNLLEQWGCEVRSYLQFPPKLSNYDIVLTDFDFGRGITLERHIDVLRSERDKGTAIVIMTGHPPEIVAKKLGPVAEIVLPKPVAPAALRSLLMSKKIGSDRSGP